VDQLGLITLQQELLADIHVAAHACRLAQERFDEGSDAGLEGCAHHLVRFYNVVEQMALRLANAFENAIEDPRRWHTELIRRLSIPIQGVRPAFFSEELREPLRELRAFRHVFTHAYDLVLDRDKLSLVLKYAHKVEPLLAGLSERFFGEVARQEGLSAPGAAS
jgi:hypothetical protein